MKQSQSYEEELPADVGYRWDIPAGQPEPALQPGLRGLFDGVQPGEFNVTDPESMKGLEVWRVAAQWDDLPPRLMIFGPDRPAGTEQNGTEGSVERQKQNRQGCQTQNLVVLEVLLLCRCLSGPLPSPLATPPFHPHWLPP